MNRTADSTLRPCAAPCAAAPLFEPDGYFMLRTPVLPVGQLLDRSGAAADPRGSALEHLRAQWDNPGVREAIYLASTSLHERLEGWDFAVRDARDVKRAQALYRYLARMSTRATPFGLCAAVSSSDFGSPGANARVPVDTGRVRRHTRLDSSGLARLGQALTDDAALFTELRPAPNDTLRRVGDRWHYVSWASRGGRRHYELSAVVHTDYLAAALDAAWERRASVREIVEAILAVDADIDPGSAHDYVRALVDACVLVSPLEPSISGPDALQALIARLQDMGDIAGPVLARVQQVQVQLEHLDRAGPGCAPQAYEPVLSTLAALGITGRVDRLMHVDLHWDSVPIRLPYRVARDVARAAELHYRVGARRRGPLDPFCEAFRRRYGDRRVPLLEVLDEETGLGYAPRAAVPSELLLGVDWERAGEAAEAQPLDAALLARWGDGSASRPHEVELLESELPALDKALRRAIPSGVAAMATVLAVDAVALERGEHQIVFHGTTGPGVATLLGRFCAGDDELATRVQASLAAEEAADPGAVYAEIVHLPQDRLGNLVCRPRLRTHEIPLLGQSEAQAADRIMLQDLLVEVRARQVVLWSQRLGKRVVPRMSNAHNYGKASLGVYRFLCDLQKQDTTVAGFRWGDPARSLPRLPRVRCGNVILALAQWRLATADCRELLAATPFDRAGAVACLRERWGLPRVVGVVNGDNVLAIDLDNPVAVEALVHELAPGKALRLTELALQAQDLCIGQDDRRFTHEVVVPLHRPMPKPAPARTESTHAFAPVYRPVSSAERCRSPGSDWLYYRLYGGAGALDRALAHVLAPLADRLCRSGAAERWFFIRYGDPDWHLRLRFQGPPARLAGEVLPAMAPALEGLVADQAVVCVELGTYERELERYGGPVGMALCEQWFAQDSRRVARLLPAVLEAGGELRWQLAAACLLGDLQDLGLDAARALSLLEDVSSAFKAEFEMRGARLATLGRKYRDHAALLHRLCDGELPKEAGHEVREILQADRSLRRGIAARLHAAGRGTGTLWDTVDGLLPSLLHMSCNRWFADNGRAHEMVLYELLRRGLTSRRARHLLVPA